jgi:hypothetical protein
MKIWLISVLLFGSCFAKAECYYSEYQVVFQISISKTSSIICYQSFSSCELELDSLSNQGYLIRKLKQQNSNDKLLIYNNRVAFHYCLEGKSDCADSTKAVVFSLVEPIILNRSDVDFIKVLSAERYSVFEQLSTPLSLSDSTWHNQVPQTVLEFEAYLCSHSVFIFKEKPEVISCIQALNALQEKVDNLSYEALQLEGDNYDAKIWEYIEELAKEDYLVIVSSCTD